MISQEMLLEVLPRWDSVMRAIHVDVNATRDFGWVKEMFAFTLAMVSLPSGVPDVLVERGMMIQPPFDSHLAVEMNQVSPATSPFAFLFKHAILAIRISHHSVIQHGAAAGLSALHLPAKDIGSITTNLLFGTCGV